MHIYYLSSRKNIIAASLSDRKEMGGDLFSVITQDLSLVRT